MKKSFYFYTSIALLIILGLVIGNYIFGWTTPTANPPSSNLPRPIDTGSSKQPKEGYLAVGTTTTPNYPLEVVGTMQVWGQLISKVASGNAPMVVDSPTLVTNLNADKLDGYDASDLQASAVGYINWANCTTTMSCQQCSGTGLTTTINCPANFELVTSLCSNRTLGSANVGYEPYCVISDNNSITIYCKSNYSGVCGSIKCCKYVNP